MAEEIKNTPEVKVRYSDEELQEFKAIILEMLEKAKKEYKTLRDVVTHDSSNDIEDTSPTFKNKTYGVCRMTGKLIPKERLRLVPHATLTVEAKEMMNKNK